MSALKRHLPAAVRMILGGTFVYAAVLKIADPVSFAGSIAAYQIVPYFVSYLTAAILPFLELLCGILLIVGYRVRGAGLIIALLNVVFIAALASAVARGLDIDCGCFKQGGAKTSPWVAIGRDLVLLAMAVFVLKGDRKEERAAVISPCTVEEGEG